MGTEFATFSVHVAHHRRPTNRSRRHRRFSATRATRRRKRRRAPLRWCPVFTSRSCRTSDGASLWPCLLRVGVVLSPSLFLYSFPCLVLSVLCLFRSTSFGRRVDLHRRRSRLCALRTSCVESVVWCVQIVIVLSSTAFGVNVCAGRFCSRPRTWHPVRPDLNNLENDLEGDGKPPCLSFTVDAADTTAEMAVLFPSVACSAAVAGRMSEWGPATSVRHTKM